ncbi:MAG: phosphodiester glycosidase family protein [Bacteroidales bacterium]|nr:phosphodiester glycosidase family protein [Bacteroidales bacterium]
MKRRIYIIVLFLAFALCLQAQRDSIAFVKGNWKTDTLDGMVLHQCQFDGKQLFASNQQIFVLEIPDTSHYTLAFAHEPRRTRTSEMALKHAAVAAVNGSFFDMEKHFPICYLRIDSVNLGENTPGKDTVNRKYYQYGTLCLGGDSIVILKTDSSRHWEETLPYPNIMTAGPLLIWHDTLQYMRNDRTFVTQRHNRTAVGIREDGTVLLFVADGRFKQAEGLTLTELQQLLRWLGCRDALNLDGGGSTTMYLNLGDYQGVINYPSDNARFDHAGERGVSNAVMVIKNADIRIEN